MNPVRILPLLIATATLAGCDKERPAPAPDAAVANAETRFPVDVGGKTLRVRLAVTELELAKGLMHSTGLPADEGMLFLFRESGRRGFWMVNVPYDIDAGYFTPDGRLDEVVRLRANDATVVNSASDNVRYVLETPAGWFAARGLHPGATLDLRAAAGALTARGFRAEEFVATAER